MKDMRGSAQIEHRAHSSGTSRSMGGGLTRMPRAFRQLFCWCVYVYVCTFTSSFFADALNDGSGLPVLPSELPAVEPSEKMIPRKIWVAVKDANDEHPKHLLDFFGRNPTWQRNICDNACKDKFMNTTFGGTALHWAYYMINPAIGAARADIWRYCVLYTFGGLYLDDDSDIGTLLDEVVKPDDHLIMSEEGASSLGPCYVNTYHLSEYATFQKYTNYSSAPFYSHIASDSEYPQFFHGHTLVNWGIFVKPRHPLIYNVLHNIVDIIRSEYSRETVLFMARWDVRWKLVMCSTNFVMTYTLRNMILEDPTMPLPRISVNNFREYGGRVKAIWTGGDPNHYMKAMQRKGGPHLLKEHAPITMESTLKYLEGRAVMGDAGKAIFLIQNGTRKMFPDYETFLKMKYQQTYVKHVPDTILSAIPVGPDVESLMGVDVDADGNLVKPKGEEKPKLDTAKTGTGSAGNSGGDSGGYSRSAAEGQSGGFVIDPHGDNVTMLQNVEREIAKHEVLCFGDDYAGTRDDLLSGRWETILGSVPVMVNPMCLRTFQLGNTLGYFFNDLACADVAGAHFLAVAKHFDIAEADAKMLVTQGDAQTAFFRALPAAVAHPQPLELQMVRSNMKKECTCLQYCWEHSEPPWMDRLEYIGKHLRAAVDAYLAAAKEAGHTHTELNNATDLSTAPMGSTQFPMIPDVAVQYRCGDNIGFGKTRYGLLPFAAIVDRIPKDSQTIYVVADSPTRQAYHPYTSRCGVILEALFKRIKAAFPNALVVIKRGGDLFLDVARLTHSKVLICSASTFCLWPAIANQHAAHYPLTPLVGRATNESAPDLGSRFHWIRDYEILKEFKHFRPWTSVIDVLDARPTR